MATLGGYIGEGVAAANLAGRTLAELIVGEETVRTGLPWVGATNRKWDAFDKQVEDGNAKAEELSARFGPWYYVISEELFQKLKPSRGDLIKKPEEQAGDNK